MKSKIVYPTTTALANEFSRILHSWLTPRQMKLVIARNNKMAYGDYSICHSHDFCDANQAMLDAFQKLGVDHESGRVNIMNKKFLALWEESWRMARNNHFNQIHAKKNPQSV